MACSGDSLAIGGMHADTRRQVSMMMFFGWPVTPYCPHSRSE